MDRWIWFPRLPLVWWGEVGSVYLNLTSVRNRIILIIRL